MSVTNTVLIYVGIPTLLVLLITGFVMAGSARSGPRYRPGRPFDFTPVWFLSSPDQLSDRAEVAALAASGARPALPAGKIDNEGTPAPARGTGGASDRW